MGKNCEQRIDEKLRLRLNDFQNLVDRFDSDGDTVYDDLYNYPLCVEEYKLYRVHLSTGGPGDWFEVMVGEDREILCVTYHFNDWFDHAERNLWGDDYDLAYQVLEHFIPLDDV